MSDVIETGYRPRKFQAYLHKELERFNVLCCHRRFGKTVFSINEMLDRGLRCNRKNPQYAYVAPNYAQAKRVAWDYIKEFTKHIPGVTYNEKELRCDIPRPWLDDKVRFVLLGAENPDSLRGIYLDGAILDEYATMTPVVWTHVIRPALSDRTGWAIFISTPAGRNHFWEIYHNNEERKGWFCKTFSVSDTKVLPELELADARATMSEEAYAQEYLCDWTAAVQGAYYAKYISDATQNSRIVRVPYDPSVPVYTGWDLGIGDSTTIWFCQLVGPEVHIIDYIEEHGKGLEWYVNEIKSKRYIYDEHFLPHDAKARELGTGKSREEMLRKFGLRVTVLPRSKVEDGIQAVRNLLPKCYFDKDMTHTGVLALQNYQRKFDDKNNVFVNKPKHDWSSHGADGFRTLAMGLRAGLGTDRWKNLPRQANLDYNEF